MKRWRDELMETGPEQGQKTEMGGWVIECVFAVYWTVPLLMSRVQRTYCLKSTQGSQKHAGAWTDNPGLYRKKTIEKSFCPQMLPEGWTEKCDTPGSVIAQVHRPREQLTSDVYVRGDGGSEFSFSELHECYPCFLCVRESDRDTSGETMRQREHVRWSVIRFDRGSTTWLKREWVKKEQQCRMSFIS